MARNTHCRVVVSVDAREVALVLIDSNGERLEEERFSLVAGSADINAKAVATDVFQLLYQCANDAVNGGDD